MIDPGWERRPKQTFVGLLGLLAALFFGGIAVGLAIALYLAGGTVGAVVVGFAFLPICLGLGMWAWRAVLVAWVAGGVLSALVRSRGDEEAFHRVTAEQLRRAAPNGKLPGAWVFVPVASAVALVAAIAMAVVADGDRLVAGAAVLVAGVAYGALLRQIAARGWLPPPGE